MIFSCVNNPSHVSIRGSVVWFESW